MNFDIALLDVVFYEMVTKIGMCLFPNVIPNYDEFK